MGDYILDKKYLNVDFRQDNLSNTEYENCTFQNCNLVSLNLSNTQFTDCVFDTCDFSMTQLNNTGFRDIEFENCKLVGLNFEDINKFMCSFSFKNCILDYSIFTRLNIEKTLFSNCSIVEADFSFCKLKLSKFVDCNLSRTVFNNTDVRNVDFTSSQNYSIDPENNIIKKAKFSTAGLRGLLDKYDIVIE